MILSPGLGGVMTILGVQQVQCCRMNHLFQDCPEMSVAMDRKRFSAAGLEVKERAWQKRRKWKGQEEAASC